MKVITVYNNKELLKAGLLASHPSFLASIDLILIDSSLQKYNQIPEALLDVLDPLDINEPIVIAHQDVIDPFFENNSKQIILN